MGLDENFIKHGLTLENHWRPVRILIDKEMDGMKMFGQEMEWATQCDREIEWSNRHGQEMSWKLKIKNQNWKWNIRRIFIIQMSIRSNLAGPGTRWIGPQKMLFKKVFFGSKSGRKKQFGLGLTQEYYARPLWYILNVFCFIIYVKLLGLGFGIYKLIMSRFGILNQLGLELGFGFP